MYIYNATGVKLKKTVNVSITDYAGNYIYENDELQFFNHPEGYATPVNAADYDSGFYYVYQYKDHLGNIRLSYTDNNGNLEIVEENNYYPFGLKMRGFNTNVSSLGNSIAQKRKFGGKELQDDVIGNSSIDWYDFGARNYDAALGRWMKVDPLAEGYENWSPYGYAFSNPVYFIDPDGERIKIGDNYYSYEKDRNYDEIEDEFERNTYMALDKLYSSGAMKIDFGGDIGVVDVLDKLISDDKFTVNILQSSNERSSFLKNNLRFADKFGVVVTTKEGVSEEALEKVSETGKLTEGVGYNSPASQLGHELVHSYNYNFDKGKYDKKNRCWVKGIGYFGRKKDFSTRPSYSNAEEKRTTTLSNQINHTLGEAKRFDYRGVTYQTESPTSIKPIKVKAND